MTQCTTTPRRVNGGRLAFLLSLTLHATLGLSLLSLRTRVGGSRPAPPPQLDAVAVAGAEPASLSLIARPRQPRRQRPRAEEPILKRPSPSPGADPSAPPGGLTERAPTPAAAATPKPNAGTLFASAPSVHEPSPGRSDQGVGKPGGGGTTAFFQVQTEGEAIVYVIDHSASMGPNGGLDAARRELAASLARLPATARFQIIVYNRSAEALCIDGRTGLVAATEDHKRQAALLLKAVPAEGGTDHLPALRRALSLQPEAIFFLTDADDLTESQVRAVTEINRRQNGGRTAIHAIELNTANRDRADMPLHALARVNNGTYQAVSLGTDPD